jgi:hypothetical protein
LVAPNGNAELPLSRAVLKLADAVERMLSFEGAVFQRFEAIKAQDVEVEFLNEGAQGISHEKLVDLF